MKAPFDERVVFQRDVNLGFQSAVVAFGVAAVSDSYACNHLVGDAEPGGQGGQGVPGLPGVHIVAFPVGEPFFDSVESMVSHAVFSIPGVRGIEFGDGFRASAMKGSEHNDPIVSPDGKCSRNGAGGINGGITNGNPLVFRVAFKPTSSIGRQQRTYDFTGGKETGLEIPGRHDVCFALRTPPVVEAMTSIVLADMKLTRF